MLYAPGAYTGYAVKTLPAVREPIELRHWPSAASAIPMVADTLNAAASAPRRGRNQAHAKARPRRSGGDGRQAAAHAAPGRLIPIL